MTDALNPFTDAQFTEMEEKLVLAEVTERAIAKAKQAGIDTGNQLELIREAATKIKQILHTYKE